MATSSSAAQFSLFRFDANPNPQQLTETTFSSLGTGYAVLGNVIVFAGCGELWRTDGTPGGTFALPTGVLATGNFNGAHTHDRVLFTRTTAAAGAELWVTDGTVAGTVMLSDLYPGPVSSNPRGFGSVNGKVYFMAESPGAGVEPWVTDGTAAGTHAMGEVFAGLGSAVAVDGVGSNAALFVGAGNRVLFVGEDEVDGTQLRSVFICRTDFDGNSTIDPDDLADFITAFFDPSSGSAADFDASGTVDPDDLTDFIAAYFGGEC